MKTLYSVKDQVKIKNEVGTSRRSPCSCGSWLSHWKKYAKTSPGKCSVAGCKNDASVGAHITRPNAKIENYKTHSYIVPMCDDHNGQHGKIFTSKQNCTFVWANVSKTCGS